MPFNIRTGVSYRITNDLTTAFDINIPNDDNITLHFGTEYIKKIKDIPLAIRAGYKTNNSLNFISNLSFGFGVSKNKYIINYAIVPYGLLGTTHRLTLSLKL